MHKTVFFSYLAAPPVRCGLAMLLLAPQLQGCKSCHETSIVATDEVDSDEPNTDFDGDWGSWLSMATMSDGSPAVAFYDKTSGAAGFATGDLSTDPVTWTYEEPDGYVNDEGLDVGNRGKYMAMAVASDGTVWLSYQDVLNEVLRFATRDPSSGEWTNEMADMGAGSSPSAGFFSSIALDSSDSPVIAHYDKATGQLRVAHYSGGAFTSEVVDEGEPFEPDTGAAEAADADVGQYASLVIENDIEYIGYYDAANGDLKLAIGTAGDYEIETVYSEGNVGAWPDILIDGGSLTIAFQDVENQNLLLATGTSGNFSTTIVDDAEYVGADSDLFMNGNALSIAYFDGQNNDMLLATKSGSDWTIDTVVGSEGALGFHNETISIGGVVYAGCYDYTERTLWFSALE